MHRHNVYIMQDQVTDRVNAIMASDFRHPELRRSALARPLVLVAALALLNALAATVG